MLNDTDFDGLQDNIDSNKTSGLFKGNTGQVGDIDFKFFGLGNSLNTVCVCCSENILCMLLRVLCLPCHQSSSGSAIL